MFTQRGTAYKLNAKDLVSNPYVPRDGGADYVEVGDLQVSRARLMATVVNKITYDEKHSGFLVLDDGTETVRARVWENNFDLIDNVVIGDLVDLVGRVKQYNEETYLIPEIINKACPDSFVLRKAELNKKPLKVKSNEAPVKEVSRGFSKDDMYELIKKCDKGQGAVLNDLIDESKLDKQSCLQLVRELMGDGVVFEPKAGKYRALD